MHHAPSNGDYSNEGTNQTANDYGAAPLPTFIDDRSYLGPSAEGRHHNSSAAPYTEGLTYACGIIIEEDEVDTTNTGNSSIHYSVPDQSPPRDYYTHREPSLNGTATDQHSPTVRRWSRENAPDERLRLGLPRWESEQHRAAYQNGSEIGSQQDQQITPAPQERGRTRESGRTNGRRRRSTRS